MGWIVQGLPRIRQPHQFKRSSLNTSVPLGGYTKWFMMVDMLSMTPFQNSSDITHRVTSTYRPSSNGLAERGVWSIKGVLAKTHSLTKKKLQKMCFDINNHTAQDWSGTPNSRFLRRAPHTALPNSMEKDIKHQDLLRIRNGKQKKPALQKGSTSKEIYVVGDVVWVK